METTITTVAEFLEATWRAMRARELRKKEKEEKRARILQKTKEDFYDEQRGFYCVTDLILDQFSIRTHKKEDREKFLTMFGFSKMEYLGQVEYGDGLYRLYE